MAANFLQKSRHGSVFYFRRRVPGDLRRLTGQTQVFRTLYTTDRREAVVRARALATDTDRIFASLRDMAKRDKAFRTDFKLKAILDELGRLDSKVGWSGHAQRHTLALAAVSAALVRTLIWSRSHSAMTACICSIVLLA